MHGARLVHAEPCSTSHTSPHYIHAQTICCLFMFACTQVLSAWHYVQHLHSIRTFKQRAHANCAGTQETHAYACHNHVYDGVYTNANNSLLRPHLPQLLQSAALLSPRQRTCIGAPHDASQLACVCRLGCVEPRPTAGQVRRRGDAKVCEALWSSPDTCSLQAICKCNRAQSRLTRVWRHIPVAMAVHRCTCESLRTSSEGLFDLALRHVRICVPSARTCIAESDAPSERV